MSDWAAARDVLAVRLDSMGDVLMCTPAIRAMTEAGKPVTLLTSPAGAAIARLVPEIAEVIVWSAPWMKATAQADPQVDRAMIDRLAERGFDAAVIFTCYSQNPLPAALLCHLAGIPLRAAHVRDKPYALLSDPVAESEPERGIRHEVRRQLDLVATLGFATDDERMSLAIHIEARAAIEQELRALNLSDARPWALVHPGASAESRRWPPAHFAATIRELAREGWRVLVTGGRDERALVDELVALSGDAASTLPRDLSLAELAALIEAAPLMIANNSGPMHIAAALGTPTVCLYALTNPQHTPWMTPSIVLNHDVPCAWCARSICPEGHHNCLRLVEPGQVAAAALELHHETARVRV